MIKYLITSLLLFVIGGGSQLLGLTKYGDAKIDRGSMIIIRDGKQQTFDKIGESFEIFKDDVVRVGKGSLVKLQTIENVKMTLGSNAVFQVRPWQVGSKTGYMRMLYGKSRIKTSKSGKHKRRFRMRTAMAIVGIKGSESINQTNAAGQHTQKVTQGTFTQQAVMSDKEETVNMGNQGIVSSSISSGTMEIPNFQKQEAKKEKEGSAEKSGGSAKEGDVEKKANGAPVDGEKKEEAQQTAPSNAKDGETVDAAPSVAKDGEAVDAGPSGSQGDGNMDAAPPTSKEANQLDVSNTFVSAGLTTQSDLDTNSTDSEQPTTNEVIDAGLTEQTQAECQGEGCGEFNTDLEQDTEKAEVQELQVETASNVKVSTTEEDDTQESTTSNTPNVDVDAITDGVQDAVEEATQEANRENIKVNINFEK